MSVRNLGSLLFLSVGGILLSSLIWRMVYKVPNKYLHTGTLKNVKAAVVCYTHRFVIGWIKTKHMLLG